MKKNIIPTPEHYKAMQFCFKNNIKISVYPTKKGLKVQINNNNNIFYSPKIYSKIEANNKIWELYLHFFKKK